MKRVGKLFDKLISDENLSYAIDEVNASHHWHARHRPNRCTAWVEETKPERVKELRGIIVNGFEQKPPKVTKRWDASARKWRVVSEPAQWPDQYVHHALIQIIQPVCMRGMDPFCCGSIRGRGPHKGKRAIERWMARDTKGTRYTFTGDIQRFYNSLQPEVIMACMRRLIKDARVLDLIWRIIKDGVLIGAYPSQWFANTVLQELDRLIRQSGLCAHYVRYMDNITVFGANKRSLRKLKRLIKNWFAGHGLNLKSDWQIYRAVGITKKAPIKPPRKGVERAKQRLPDAMGYRYGRGFTLPRKHNLIRVKRALARFRLRRDSCKRIAFRAANGLISRLGQLKHCNNESLYKMLFAGERILRQLKDVVKKYAKEGELTWNTFLAQRAARRLCAQRAQPTAT